MSGKWIVGVALMPFVSAFAANVPRLTEQVREPVHVGAVSDCVSGEPCLRVYKTLGDAPKTYRVVSFSEADLAKAENEGKYQLVHEKIVDETGFDCKKGKFANESFFECEEGGFGLSHEGLRRILHALYE